jgi:hypothetical protein
MTLMGSSDSAVLAQVFEIAKVRARVLGIKYAELASGTFSGAYHAKPWDLTEYTMHEAAHLLTLGHTTAEFPRLRLYARARTSLTGEITERMQGISETVADALEIDTAVVTYLAGYALNFWDDPDPIIVGCTKNLSGGINHPAGIGLVRKAFQVHPSRASYRSRAEDLAEWFWPDR